MTIYSQLYLKEKSKIPFFVIFLLIFTIGGFFAYVFSNISVPSKAKKTTKEVREYQITNLSPNHEVTVFWRSMDKESGWIVLYDAQKKPLARLYSDERDTQTVKNLFYNHYVVLREIPNEAAFFKIGAGDEKKIIFQYDNFYPLPKPREYTQGSNLSPAYGIVLKPNNEPLADAIVILSVDDAYSLSTMTKSKGEWLIPLNAFYKQDDLQIIIPSEKQKATIRIYSEDYGTSTVSVAFADLSTLPKVKIGNDYQLQGEDVLSSSTKKNEKGMFDIFFPSENAVIPGSKPLIKGTALPGKEVVVSIDLKEGLSSRAIADKDGVWKVIFPVFLPPGKYLLTATTKDELGKEMKIERKFVIAKAGEQVLGEATDEATVVPTRTPIPTQILSQNVSPTQTAPISGNSFNPVIIGSSSLIIIGLGILLAF